MKFQRNSTVCGVRAVMLRTDRHNRVCKVVARAGRPRIPCSISDSDMSVFFSFSNACRADVGLSQLPFSGCSGAVKRLARDAGHLPHCIDRVKNA